MVVREDLVSRHYPEARFGGFSDIDGDLIFYNRVRALADESFHVLDVGCGRGALADASLPYKREMCRLDTRCASVVGIDVDPAAETNPFVTEFRLITDARRWPVPDHSIDLCICNWVIEHVRNPTVFFSEARRVLRPGGFFCARTPNIHSYFGLASRIVPAQLHVKVGTLGQRKDNSADFFPTVYACNTRRELVHALTALGFDCCVYPYEAEPNYLMFSKLLFRLGVLHQRFAPRRFRLALFVFARKSR